MRPVLLTCVVVGFLSGCPSDPPSPPLVLGALSGRVVIDAAGGATPVAGARVEVSGARLAVLSGADGRFKFEGFSAGSYVLRLSDGANARVVSTSLEAVDGGAASRDLGDVAIGRRSSLTVRVVDGGAPVRDATVVVEPEWARGVDGSGLAVFDDVPGGSWAVVATRVEGELLRTVRATVDVPLGGDAERTLDLATGTLSGPGDVVVPVELVGGEGDARIRLETQGHPDIERSVDGAQVRVPRVPPGIYTVRVEGEGFASTGLPLVVVAGETSLPTLRLVATSVVEACGAACAVDACAGDVCGASSTCEEIGGHARCGCVAGFDDPSAVEGSGAPWACVNVDECAAGTHDCGENSLCSDVEGAFTCGCRGGFSGDASGRACVDVDECDAGTDDCDANATCTNTVGGFACDCVDGYVGDGESCVEVNECADGSHDCGPGSNCSNTAGSFACECRPGFVGDATGRGCEDVDECVAGTDDCGANSLCSDTDGAFTCTCQDGYAGDASGRNCEDVDECVTSANDCADPADCVNGEGSFACVCGIGYVLDGTGKACVDVDECAANANDCAPEATCGNTAGAFTCSCDPGFAGDGRTCVNVDECVVGGHDCGTNSLCSDTVGAFTCACAPGFEGDASGRNCVSILRDECALDLDDCGNNSTCTDEADGFSCACDAGYLGSPGGRGCLDVNECTSDIDDCGVNSNCQNTVGSFTCACLTGFNGDATGRSCVDVDECGTTDDCADDATCTNTPGAFTCACDAGYSGDGRVCVEVDECAANTHTCGANSTCTNTLGAYTCACRPGFTGDATGRNCRDPNRLHDPPVLPDAWQPVFPSSLGSATFVSLRGYGDDRLLLLNDARDAWRVVGQEVRHHPLRGCCAVNRVVTTAERTWVVSSSGYTTGGSVYAFNGTGWATLSGAPTDLSALGASPSGEVWAGGALGRIDRFNGSSWTTERTAVTGQPRLNHIGSDGTEVYAVASSTSVAPRVYRRDGASWVELVAPVFASTAEYVTAFAIVGGMPALGTSVTSGGVSRGALLTWDGAAWTRHDAPGRPVVDLQARGSELWGVTDGGAVFRFEAGAFTFLPPLGRTLGGLYVPPTGGPWVAGSDGLLTRWTGSEWAGRPWRRTTANATWTDASGSWAVGDGGVIERFQGGTWSSTTASTGADLLGVHASAPNEAWATGQARAIQRWDGTSWRAEPPPAFLSASATGFGPVWSFGSEAWVSAYGFKDTWRWSGGSFATQMTGMPTSVTPYLMVGNSLSNVWLVGLSMAWWNGTTWAQVASPGTVKAAWGASPTDLWLGGNSRGLWRRTGGPPGTVTSYGGSLIASLVPSTSAVVTGLWGSGTNDVWASISTGEVLRWNGTAWALAGKPTTRALNAITGTGPNDVWALGEGKYRWDGTRWATVELPLPDTGSILALHAAADGTVWGVGTNGYLFRRALDGSVTYELIPVTTTALRAVHASGNHLWAVGDAGTIVRFDGTGWTATPSGTTRVLYGVVGDGADAWAVGATGTILRWNGTVWAPEATGLADTPTWRGITRLGDGSPLVVGLSGRVSRWTGTGWVNETGPLLSVNHPLYGVATVPGTNRAFAIGDLLWKRADDGVWSSLPTYVPPSNPGTKNAIAVRSDTHVSVTDSAGWTARYDGSSWFGALVAPDRSANAVAILPPPQAPLSVVGSEGFGLVVREP